MLDHIIGVVLEASITYQKPDIQGLPGNNSLNGYQHTYLTVFIIWWRTSRLPHAKESGLVYVQPTPSQVKFSLLKRFRNSCKSINLS
jgi:hypothetical protein